ncbi:MAG TPA: hypothetical protein VNL18_02060 [Gemmatimonadales bacterium]|nr:hypothetical protein [Gemmatimonadales bacterium]
MDHSTCATIVGAAHFKQHCLALLDTVGPESIVITKHGNSRAAGDHHAPLALVAAPHIRPRVAISVLDFARQHAPAAAAGVVARGGRDP